MRLLTLARDLKRRKARERQSLFVAEGVRTVEELLQSSLTVRGAVVSVALGRTPRGSAAPAKGSDVPVTMGSIRRVSYASGRKSGTDK